MVLLGVTGSPLALLQDIERNLLAGMIGIRYEAAPVTDCALMNLAAFGMLYL
ncbi:hypothetical protein [Synechococcus sp. CBW1006]|uniref:hypothetical protein n=1 Tax=Synechococcus sp. CBW1006 TaxID=1353138 RepID=UPI0018CFBCC7|nr:hypothetical protein [Synechococcus sp. CBW1006]QPN65997.1 hypothetical protein H8F26_14280 [Synechococcus sp. CBW1006]